MVDVVIVDTVVVIVKLVAEDVVEVAVVSGSSLFPLPLPLESVRFSLPSPLSLPLNPLEPVPSVGALLALLVAVLIVLVLVVEVIVVNVVVVREVVVVGVVVGVVISHPVNTPATC